MMEQTKNDTLFLQVEGCADGLVTLLRKTNIYLYFTTALTRADFTRKTSSATRE
jgi:hypothetical protein